MDLYQFHNQISVKNDLACQIKKMVSQDIPDFEVPMKMRKAFERHASGLESYHDFHRRKFLVSANGYHVFWAGVSKNILLRNIGKFYQKIACNFL